MCVITEKDKEYLQELASERMTAIQFVATGYGVPDVAFACRLNLKNRSLYYGKSALSAEYRSAYWSFKRSGLRYCSFAGNPDITCIVIGKGKELFSSVPGVTFTGFVEEDF